MKKTLLFLLTLLLTCSMSMWGRNYQSYTYEYAFSWTNDVVSGGEGVLTSGGTKSNNKYYVLQVQMISNYAKTGAMGYPALLICQISSQSANQENGYTNYTLGGVSNCSVPYNGTYTSTTTTTSPGSNDRGKIITQSTINSKNAATKFYDVNGTAHTFKSGTITYKTGLNSKPYIIFDATMTDNTTVYATIGDPVVITTSVSPAGVATVSGADSYGVNENVTLSVTNTTEGYKFVEWTKSNQQKSTSETYQFTATSSTAGAYVANFKQLAKPTITASAQNGEVSGIVNGQTTFVSGTAYWEESVIAFTATPASGYIVDYWTNNGVKISGSDGKASINCTVATSNANIVAICREPYDYTVSTAATNGSITGVVQKTGATFVSGNTYKEGDKIELTATGNSGYAFKQWSDGNTDNPRTITVDGNKTYTAEFVQGVVINVPGYSIINNYLNSGVMLVDGMDGLLEAGLFIYTNSLTSTGTKELWVGTDYETGQMTAIYEYTDDTYEHWTEHWATSATATIEKVSGSTNAYHVAATIVADGVNYFVDMKYLVISGDLQNTDDDGSFSSTYSSSNMTVESSQSFPGRGIKTFPFTLSKNTQQFSTQKMCLEFITDITAAGLPSMIYDISDNMQPGTLSANTLGGTYYSYATQKRIGSTCNYYLVTGAAEIINPNLDSKPMFLQVAAQNSYGQPVNATMGSEPALRQVTLASASDGNTATMASKEGHGYPQGGVEAGMEGDYYYQGTKLTLTATPATGYRFVRWKNGSTPLSTNATYEYTVGSSDVTITPEFELQKFTVTIAKDPSDYGTVSQTSVANVPYGTVITTNNNKVTINGTIVTATPATATAQYTYALDSWTNGTATVTEATTVTANFSRTTNKYAVTINTPEHGTLTVKNDGTPIASGTEVDYGTVLAVTYEADDHYHFAAWTNDGAESVTVNAAKTIGATFAINTNTLTWDLDGGTITTAGTAAGQVAYGTTLTAPEVEKAGYTFAGWDPEVDETMPDNDVTYTAQWEEASTFTLEDQYDAGENYYATLEDFVGGDAKDVTYARTFQGGTAETPYWNVFSLPFDYMLAGSSHPFAGKVLDLSSASYDAVTDEVTLNFLYETYQIEANKPYALINKGGDIVNPVFENVTFETLGENTYSVPCTTGGTVTFVNTTCRQLMEANNRNILFIGNNQLLYPGADAYLRAFRGYFLLENVLPQNAAPKRVRLMIEGESVATGLSTEFAPEVQSAKRIEDGVLIIERNGNRYDAQGKEMK